MNIIVTGASRGIGHECVKSLSRDGHRVVAVSRDRERLEALKHTCLAVNPRSEVFPVQFDLNRPDIVPALIPEVLQYLPEVDILINNAGAILNKPLEEVTPEEVHRVYATNVFGVIHLIQGLLPYMGRGKRTHIVNISSMGGIQGSAKFAGLSVYSSSKGALAVLTECLAEEFKGKDIFVNCLALGAAQTEMLQAAFPGYNAPVTAAEMAGFVTDFALHGHRYFNGKILPVSLSTP